jgi:hypothetical protein
VLQLPSIAQPQAWDGATDNQPAREYLQRAGDFPSVWGTLFGWWAVHALGQMAEDADTGLRSRSWIDEWLLGRGIADALRGMGLDEASAWHAVNVVKLLILHQGWLAQQSGTIRRASAFLESWLRDDEILEFIKVNRYEGVLWFNKESFEELLWWMFALAAIESAASPSATPARISKSVRFAFQVVESLQRAEAESNYKIEMLLGAARKLDTPKARTRRPTRSTVSPRRPVKSR